MNMLHPLEEATIHSFMNSARRNRFLTLLASAKRRQNIILSLNHFTDWDRRFARQLRPTDDAVAILAKEGAGEMCHLISDSRELDGRGLPIAQAVAEAEAYSFATIVCCHPAGKLAMFFDEAAAPRTRLLLRRP
jgi:hypothetical protein